MKDFIYTKRNLNLLCIIISIFIYFSINWIIPKSENVKVAAKLIEVESKQEVVQMQGKWCLEIPKINLKAPIVEGTSADILNKYIGHFEETGLISGNIGLAAHNRGYPVNYFSGIKNLIKGDKLFYTYNGITLNFAVENTGIIEETDWSKLEKTKETKLTLITCVENKPNKRRFVQATQIA